MLLKQLKTAFCMFKHTLVMFVISLWTMSVFKKYSIAESQLLVILEIAFTQTQSTVFSDKTWRIFLDVIQEYSEQVRL